jgi:hypothetical protein
VNFFHVDFEVVSAFEHLSTLATGVWHKTSLVLVSDMSEESALQVEASVARKAPIFDALGRLAHGIHGVLLRRVQAF